MIVNTWTAEEINALKLYHADGFSFSQISARIIGRTRDSCISKARKLRLDRRSEGGPRKTVLSCSGTVNLPDKRPPRQKPKESTYLHVDIESRADGCCFPTQSDGKNHLFCGLPVKKTRPDGLWNYCDFHKEKMFQPSNHPRSVREAHRISGAHT